MATTAVRGGRRLWDLRVWGTIVGATGATVFVLGSLMAMLGAAGLLLGWGRDEQAAASSAVVTGIVMLLVIAGDAGRPQLRRG